MKNFIKTISSSLADYILPHKCLNCYNMTERGGGLCAECFSTIFFIEGAYCNICGDSFEISMYKGDICSKCQNYPPEYDKKRSLFKFDIFSKKLIHDFKYNDKTNYANYFAKLFYLKYADIIADVDIIAPIPMHWAKRLYRFYNPPTLIVNKIKQMAIENQINIMSIYDLLLKIRLTKTQTSLTRDMRIDNVKNSVILNKKYNIKGKKILLVDDVHTTGATANYCARILKELGKANQVYFFSVVSV